MEEFIVWCGKIACHETEKENKMEKTERQSLGSAPIGRLLRTFAIPSIISMVVSTLYNIVDQIFIGRGVGYLGNGATNVILPITVIALALGLMIGDGATAYFSLCLGQKELKNAAQGVGNALTLTIIVSVALTVGSFVWLQSLCVLFGATETILPYALEYGSVIVLGFPFYMFSMGFNSVVRADGSPVYAMMATLSGAILNTILDPIFIFVFHMGVTGAAIATVLGQIVSSILTVVYLRRFRSVRLTRKCLIPQGKLCAIGKPVQATLVSLSRQVLFLLPALVILPRFLGVEGALWAGPVGDACAFVLALTLGFLELRKLDSRSVRL